MKRLIIEVDDEGKITARTENLFMWELLGVVEAYREAYRENLRQAILASPARISDTVENEVKEKK